MKKHVIPLLILIVYIGILIKIMVFKDIPAIHIGTLVLNFGGIDASHPANFVPFKTIVPYILGYKGWIIAGINLIGNIILLVPVGFLVPFIYSNITWKKSLIIAILAGLTIETMQVVLHVGIFDIDDVMLNALGVMIGYWKFNILMGWIRAKKYKTIVITGLAVIAALIALYCAVVYPMTHHRINSGAGLESDRLNNGEKGVSMSNDLCGGTGGIGPIVSIGDNTLTVNKRKDGKDQIVNLTKHTTIKTQEGSGSVSNLKIGDNVTLVGGPNPDGSFTADAIFVCSS
jgi:glycopeptide antibiotics resistance protein